MKEELEEKMLNSLKRMTEIGEVLTKLRFRGLESEEHSYVSSRLEEMEYNELISFRKTLKQLRALPEKTPEELIKEAEHKERLDKVLQHFGGKRDL